MIITIELIANMYLLLFVQYDHPVPVQPDREISINEKSTRIRRSEMITEIDYFEPGTISIQLTYMWGWMGL